MSLRRIAVNSTICYSQWAINQVIIANEYGGGLKSNKIATEDFQSGDIESVVATIASFQSLRSERNLPLYRFTEIVDSSIREATDFDKEYFRFKLLPTNESPTRWGTIMKVDSRSSIIDRYNTFTEVSLCFSSTGGDADHFKKILPWVKRMCELVPDPLLQNLLLMHNSAKAVTTDSATAISCTINDLFFQGNYINMLDEARKALIRFPFYIELYEAYVIASLYVGADFVNPFHNDSIAFLVIQDIYNVFSKNDNVSNALNSLLKHSYAFKGTHFAWEIFQIFCKHHAIEGGSLNVRKASIACGILANPDASSYAMNLNLLHTHPFFKSSTILNIYSAYIKNVTDESGTDFGRVDPFQKEMIEIDMLFYTGSLKSGLEKIDNLLELDTFAPFNKIRYNRDYLIHAKATALMSLNLIGQAIEWVAKANLQENGFHNRLGSRRLISSAVAVDERDDVNLSIYTPILLVQYAVNYQVTVNEIWIAYDNFMLGVGVQNPSQLREHLENFDRLALTYFLKHVCVQETLGKSYNVYESEDDLDNERMAILGLLCEIDPLNFDEYVRELQHLSSNIEIRKGIKQINESKIYVDVPGIQLSIERELRDSYNRAVELDSLNIPELDTFLEILGDNFSVLNIKEVNNKKQLVATPAQDLKYSSNLLKYNHLRLFIKIRDMFISNSDFGLDSYISMRIRHGALINQIRSIFDNSFLVTKKDGDTGEYIWNNYWISKLDISDYQNQIMINSFFAEFSKDVDTIAGNLKNNLIQLSTEQRPTMGLFNYSYTENDLNDLYNGSLKRTRSYDDFFQAAIGELWRRTEINLQKIREIALIDVQQQIIGSLDTLSNKIGKLSFVNDLYEFSRTITECRTHFRHEIEKISSWFKRSTSTAINDFKIELPIKTSLSVVRKIHVGYSEFVPTQEVHSTCVVSGKYFIHFSDMFRNLFDNILTHSGIAENMLFVSLNVSETNGQMIISLSNNISLEKDLQNVNTTISGIREMLNSPINVDKARGEGGTGYFKIQKILRSDLGCKDFNIIIDPVNEKRVFTVTVSFDVKHLRQ